LKPENILMKPVGEGAPKIVDLDSAFSFGAEPLTSTGAGRWPGTRRYYSPEVVKAIVNDWNSGEPPQPYQYRPPSDIWALGVVLYEVLTEVPLRRGTGDWGSVAVHRP
jgi:serine/threonine protein kinase